MSDHEYNDFPDETPYPVVVQHSETPRPGWRCIAKQDKEAPTRTFPMGRVLRVGPFHNGIAMTFNVVVELFKKPPREWPPLHSGSTSAGINLNTDEVRELRDSCNEYLVSVGETV